MKVLGLGGGAQFRLLSWCAKSTHRALTWRTNCTVKINCCFWYVYWQPCCRRILVPSVSSAPLDTGYQTEDEAVQWSVHASTIIASHEAWQNGRYAQTPSLTEHTCLSLLLQTLIPYVLTIITGASAAQSLQWFWFLGIDIQIFTVIVCLTSKRRSADCFV
jgi:hypothetical protein